MGAEYHLKQGNNYQITFNLVDEDGVSLPLSVLGTFLCTLYYYNPELTTSDPYHLATINSRYNQDILNANNFAITVDGECTWEMQALDNPKLDSNTDEELHIALLTWKWSGKSNSDELLLYVQKVPFSV